MVYTTLPLFRKETLFTLMVGPRQVHETANNTLEILAHHRRRYALQCLRKCENPIALADLADEVASREYDEPLAELSAETVKRVYLSLYHTHIPKLADEGFVQYNQEPDSVTVGEHVEQFEQLRAYLKANRAATTG